MKSISHILLFIFCIATSSVSANGVLRNGIGTQSMATAGTSLGFNDDALAAMNTHPASVAEWDKREFSASMTTAYLDAEFKNSTTVTSGIEAESITGVLPDFAYIHPLSDRLSLGVSSGLTSALEVDYAYVDPVGALGVSHGYQTHKSSFTVMRTALGLAYKVTPDWSFGASVGLLYNRNRLKAPYVFQSHPVLAGGLGGAKVKVNLEADGFGVNGNFSTRYQLNDNININLSYTTPTSFNAEGTLRGDSGPIGVGGFSYDAEVETELPQILSAGFGWQINTPWKIAMQLEWIDWSDAFEELPIHLTNGSNAALNGIVGSNRIDDTAPLNWRDSLVFRVGTEYQWSEKMQLRAGYSYGDNPIPSETLTPLTAAIMEHTLAFGLGYKFNDFEIDMAYQWDLPGQDKVGKSSLLAGEFNNSEVDVSIHWFSVGITFSDL